ncbi:NADH:flavin oxidoreductase [Streptomyces viridochromogenes DSM 40736]|uniref:NADH:flavin oxidoreductase n=1 Tax=Streptomyces viridochromogenes (strain DSM 40736 / JCM 4977 / BCRC 1201 / Tue 494) TaxID=591159 RepID=D9XGZ6_STRVT|nr:NADH:flavin oxidoreductase [Streptomyces viridochromogenes DSM 40736]
MRCGCTGQCRSSTRPASGGLVHNARIEVEPGYQVPFARTVGEGAALPVSAVGLITAPEQADRILVDRSADAIMLAREVLRNPTWPLLAAHVLGDDVPWPKQVPAWPPTPSLKPSSTEHPGIRRKTMRFPPI